MKKTIKDTRGELKDLKVQNNSLKRQERLTIIQQKALDDAQRKATKLQKYEWTSINNYDFNNSIYRELNQRDAELRSTQQSYSDTHSKMQELEIENEALKVDLLW